MARFLAEDKRPFIKLGSLYPKSPYVIRHSADTRQTRNITGNGILAE